MQVIGWEPNIPKWIPLFVSGLCGVLPWRAIDIDDDDDDYDWPIVFYTSRLSDACWGRSRDTDTVETEASTSGYSPESG